MTAPEVTAPETPARPEIAVVVASFGRADKLPRLLDALAAQQGAPPFEVVVVDDASPDSTWQLLTGRTDVTALRQSRNAGPAAARNRGWRSSDARRIAFTDDDCIPAPDWVAVLHAALDNADVVQGRTLPDPAQLAASGPFSRTLQVESEDGFFQTCNIAYRRTVLESTGGFDERFRHPAGEDTELAWRARAAGARTAFTPGALVHHDVRPSSLLATLRDTPRWGSVVLAVRTHPPLRDRLHSRWFWRRSHPPALAAMAGLALVAAGPGRLARIAGLGLLAPYARLRLQTEPLPTTRLRQRAALLPAALLVDAAEVAVCAAASVRHRRIVL